MWQTHSQTHVRHMSDTCQTHVRHMSDTCQTHVRHVSDTCHTHVRHMSDTFADTCQTHARHMSDTCQTHVRHMAYTLHNMERTWPAHGVHMSYTCQTHDMTWHTPQAANNNITLYVFIVCNVWKRLISNNLSCLPPRHPVFDHSSVMSSASSVAASSKTASVLTSGVGTSLDDHDWQQRRRCGQRGHGHRCGHPRGVLVRARAAGYPEHG